jgi:hypothetical protein
VSPTVGRVGPYRFFFFSNEGTEAPHIHVQRDRSLAKFWLDPIALAGSNGLAPHELRYIETLVEERREIFLRAWNDFFR